MLFLEYHLEFPGVKLASYHQVPLHLSAGNRETKKDFIIIIYY